MVASPKSTTAGGTTTQLLLAFYGGDKQAAEIGARLATLKEKLSSPINVVIHRSVEFIESIKTKFDEINTSTSIARNNKATFRHLVDPLLQKAATLNTSLLGLTADVQSLAFQFISLFRARKKPENAAQQMNQIKNALPIPESKLKQLRLDQANLVRQLDSAERTGINLFPQDFQDLKLQFINKKADRQDSSPG